MPVAHENPRVCLLTDSFYPIIGGGEAHARLLSEQLIAEGTPVFVLTQKRMKQSPTFEMIGNIPVYRVAPKGKHRYGKYLMQLPVFLFLYRHRRDYDIVFVCGLRALGPVAVLVSRMLGKISILRSESCDEMSGGHIIDSCSFMKPLARILISRKNNYLALGDSFIAISKVIKQEYIECGIPQEKIAAIPNGIDESIYTPVTSEKKNELRMGLGIPGGTLFTYTGKLNKGKGLQLLLRVWKRVTSERKDIHLMLVGSGGNQFLSCESDLRQFVDANKLGKYVTFTGYVANVAEYLQSSDCFILPSESEAHPISLLEALACQIPVIATKAGGIVDILEDHKNGRLIDINSEDQLHEAIINYLDNPQLYRQLSQEGLQTVRQKYGITHVAFQYQSHFKKLLDRNEMPPVVEQG